MAPDGTRTLDPSWSQVLRVPRRLPLLSPQPLRLPVSKGVPSPHVDVQPGLQSDPRTGGGCLQKTPGCGKGLTRATREVPLLGPRVVSFRTSSIRSETVVLGSVPRTLVLSRRPYVKDVSPSGVCKGRSTGSVRPRLRTRPPRRDANGRHLGLRGLGRILEGSPRHGWD